jgi:hypothetical protein
MLAHVDDGRWHRRDELLAVGARTVPPGRALQERERMRERQNTGVGPRRDLTDDAAIRSGARHIARQSLNHFVERGRLERRGDLLRKVPA